MKKKSFKFSEWQVIQLGLTIFVFGNHILFQMSPKKLTTNFLPSDCKFQLSKALKLKKNQPNGKHLSFESVLVECLKSRESEGFSAKVSTEAERCWLRRR